MVGTSNFSFLAEHSPIFLQLATTAEQLFTADPNTTLIKLRQLGEALAQDLAARAGIEFDQGVSQADLLFRIGREVGIEPTVLQLFHSLRVEGNKATHQFQTQHREAMAGLRVARELAVWFHRSFGKQGAKFKPGAFVPLTDPSSQLRELQSEIEQLKASLRDASQRLEDNQRLAGLVAQEKDEYAALAEQMDVEARSLARLAAEREQELRQQRERFERELAALQASARLEGLAAQAVAAATESASAKVELTEELTRILIDQQLSDAGWLADTQRLTYARGARPAKGKNLAIAEWPTRGRQAADYVLFAGLTPVAVVEAKRENVNVAGKIPQAERYAAGFRPSEELLPGWQLEGRTVAWPDSADGHYQIPFAYSCNGRPFVKQIAEHSGTWFRDLRHPANLARPLHSFHTPAGLLDLLMRSRAQAERQLAEEAFGYLKLRDYQIKAIQAVEQALRQNQTRCLLAMATGTGKTRTVIGLMYRLLKAERFRRILFLVDRNALGTQATDDFKEATLEQNQTLATAYNVAELGALSAQAETRIQVATVQAMVRRVFQSDDPPPVDAYDCIIVDEAHRGYALDQEMTEGELAVRDAGQYLSAYRRVLDYFDAVRIGLTATPAKHTTEIFGRPVFTYSYREAVADDWLIDHEPPIRYETVLSRNGIHFEKGAKVNTIDPRTQAVELTELEDELHFEVDAFNRAVITEGFNRVICRQLAKELDPTSKEKALIFCATDLHADMVKRLLDEAFKEAHGDAYNEAAVRKITGQSDRPAELIRRYKNEPYPSIAITVDLLTTGIDVHPICHLVFLRRVRSRILFEQMLGRATRQCEEIGKTVFRIYDPVDIYAALEAVTNMQPLVKDPAITAGQLITELLDPRSFDAPGARPDTSHADDALDMLAQKLMRLLRRAAKRAEAKPALRARLDELESLWGVPPALLHKHLHQLGPRQAAEFIRGHANLLNQLDEVQQMLDTDYRPVIHEGEDELTSRTQTFGINDKPMDYLESFTAFIKHQLNESAALSVLVKRPRDLTREQLREVRLLLDQYGYSEAKLSTAWRNQTQQAIAAGIIGYIRQAALGEALIPFEQRVAHAMKRIYALHPWTPVQRGWLDRLAKQLVHETVLDREFVNRAFSQKGGAKQVDKILDQRLETVLHELAAALWDEAG